VDVVLAPDAGVFLHSDPLAGLKAGGALILQSDREHGEEVWAAIPPHAQAAIRERGIAVSFINAQAIAAEEARDPETRRRVTSMVFQGCALASPQMAAFTGLRGRELTRALRQLLLKRTDFTDPSEVEDDLRVLKRGMEEAKALGELPAAEGAPAKSPPGLPPLLKGHPVNEVPAMDLHRFWEQTGSSYAAARPPDNLAEPFIGSGLLPAASGALHDLGASRATYPRWIPEACTGCGACWLICPDAALPGLVSTPGQVLEAAVAAVEARGVTVEHLPRAVRTLEGKWRERIAGDPAGDPVVVHLPAAIAETLPAVRLSEAQKETLRQELDALTEEVGAFRFAITEPFHTNMEAAARGSGGLLSVTLDPSKCKGCLACVTACPDEALAAEPRTEEVLGGLRRAWAFWGHLPTSDAAYIATEPGGEGKPGLETLLLDKRAHHSYVGGDRGAPGAFERTALHLFAATLTAAMQPRVAEHLGRIDDLTGRLEQHIRLNLAIDADDPGALQAAMQALRERDFTLAELSERMDQERKPVDAEWLERVTGLLAGLKRLKWLYTEGPGGQGRAALAMAAGPEPGSPWSPAYPYNPFPFPWSALLPEETAGLAEGLFEGHMARMAEGFRAIRMTELELDEKYNPDVHDGFFARFGWRDFSEEEYLLCPPMVAVGSDRALHGAGLESLSGLLRSGKPVKVLCLDTQSYRPLAELRPAFTGAPEGQPPGVAAARATLRHDIVLVAMAHRGAYVAQGGLADIPRMLEGFRQGLNAPGPALFNVFCGSAPAGGMHDGSVLRQAALAVESRAHPWFSYDPARGEATHERLDLEGNPALDADWPSRTLTHRTGDGVEETTDAETTFADFAATVPELQHHFRVAPGEIRPEALAPLTEYLDMDGDERQEVQPYIEAVDHEGRLVRLLVSSVIVRASEERRDCWRLLRTLTRRDIVPVDEDDISDQARAAVVEKVTQSLLELAQSPEGLATALAEMAVPEGEGEEKPDAGSHA
jgi:pyruvate-ferredoxin/flavodoxin oxidoreductase